VNKVAGLNTYAVLLFVYCPSAFKAIERSARNLVSTLCWRTSELRNDKLMDAPAREAGTPALPLTCICTCTFVCGNIPRNVCGMCEANVPAECEITRRHTWFQLVNHTRKTH
jgi:hypothetical protein